MLGGTIEAHGYVARVKRGRSSEQIGMAYLSTRSCMPENVVDFETFNSYDNLYIHACISFAAKSVCL